MMMVARMIMIILKDPLSKIEIAAWDYPHEIRKHSTEFYKIFRAKFSNTDELILVTFGKYFAKKL